MAAVGWSIASIAVVVGLLALVYIRYELFIMLTFVIIRKYTNTQIIIIEMFNKKPESLYKKRLDVT